MSPVVLAMPDAEDLAAAIAAHLATNARTVELHRFPDGESRVSVPPDLAAQDAVVVARLDHPDPRMMPLMLTASAVRSAGARTCVLVAPYLPYMRQDREFAPGQAVSARVVTRLLRQSFDGLVTVDPHLHRVPTLDELFKGPCRVVHAAPLLAAWIRNHVGSPFLIGPDEESEQWVAEVARIAGAPHVVLHKERHGDRDVDVSAPRLDRASGHVPVLVDDIVSTARTMVATVRHLRNAGFPPPVCLAVHGIFAGDAYESLVVAGTGPIVTTDTVRGGTAAISVAPLLADAVASLVSA